MTRECPSDVGLWTVTHSPWSGQEGTRVVNHNCTADVGVAEGSASMSGHGGLHALGRFCDVLGLGELLCGAYGPIGEREPVGDRGKALVQALLVFAGGGEACSDIEVLRCEGALFGSVPSASTLYGGASE